jgi:type II secretory pathway component GspD/PulD (secretin)
VETKAEADNADAATPVETKEETKAETKTETKAEAKESANEESPATTVAPETDGGEDKDAKPATDDEGESPADSAEKPVSAETEAADAKTEEAKDAPGEGGEARRGGRGRGSRRGGAEEEDAPSENNEFYQQMMDQLLADKQTSTDIFYYRCKNVDAQNLKDLLDTFSFNVAVSVEAQMVIVEDTPEQLEKIRRICESVDQRIPQILVEAQIVEISLTDNFEKEIDWEWAAGKDSQFLQSLMTGLRASGATPAGPDVHDFGMAETFRPHYRRYDDGSVSSLTSFFRMLEVRGKAKILSSPNLVLRRGVQGLIYTGEDVPILSSSTTSGSVQITTTFKPVGIRLEVEPLSIRDGAIRLKISPSVSSVTRYIVSGTGANAVSNPIIAVRQAETELEVKDGELISIGGLLRDDEITETRGVPVLRSIPGVGALFRGSNKKTTKSQLIIFLHIRVLEDGEPGGVMIHRPSDVPPLFAEEVRAMNEGLRPKKSSFRRDIRRFADEDAE